MASALGLRFGLPYPSMGGNYAVTSQSIADTTSKAEFVQQATEDATLTRIGIRVTSLTGTSPLLKLGYQGVGSTGNPDGTYLGGGSPASVIVAPSGLGWTANSWQWVTLDNPIAVTRGQWFSGVVEYSSGTADGSNNISISLTISTGEVIREPYAIANLTGTRTRQSNRMIFGYGSSGTAYGSPYLTNTLQSFNSGSTPNMYGLAFTVPSGWASTYTIKALLAELVLAAGHTCRFSLYSDTTKLQDIDLDTDYTSSNSSIGRYRVLFDESTLSTLSTGTEYIIAMEPQDTTGQQIRIITLNSANDWAPFDGSTNCRLATRTGAGAWSFDSTKRPLIEAILDDLSSSGGGANTGGLVRFNAGFN